MLSRFRRLPKSGQVRHGHSRRFCCCRFINLANNSSKLDKQGFAPFAKVVEGMTTTVDKFYGGYGDGPVGGGEGPDPSQIRAQGNQYLEIHYPKLDYIKSVELVEPAAKP